MSTPAVMPDVIREFERVNPKSLSRPQRLHLQS